MDLGIEKKDLRGKYDTCSGGEIKTCSYVVSIPPQLFAIKNRQTLNRSDLELECNP